MIAHVWQAVTTVTTVYAGYKHVKASSLATTVATMKADVAAAVAKAGATVATVKADLAKYL